MPTERETPDAMTRRMQMDYYNMIRQASGLAPVDYGGNLGLGAGSTTPMSPEVQRHYDQLKAQGFTNQANDLAGQWAAQHPMQSGSSSSSSFGMGRATPPSRFDPATQGGNLGLGGDPAAGSGLPYVPGMSAASQQALQNYQGYAAAGNQGLAAMGGDASAFAKLMNPYQAQVMDQIASRYGDLRTAGTNQLNEQATAAGAFGGSRQGVAQGQMMADLGRSQMDQMGQLAYQGYGDAMGRAAQMANLGYGANGQMNAMGEYQRQVAMQQDPTQRRIGLMQQAFGAPHGTNVSSGSSGNAWGQALGTGISLAGLFLPGGK